MYCMCVRTDEYPECELRGPWSDRDRYVQLQAVVVFSLYIPDSVPFSLLCVCNVFCSVECRPT